MQGKSSKINLFFFSRFSRLHLGVCLQHAQCGDYGMQSVGTGEPRGGPHDASSIHTGSQLQSFWNEADGVQGKVFDHVLWTVKK